MLKKIGSIYIGLFLLPLASYAADLQCIGTPKDMYIQAAAGDWLVVSLRATDYSGQQYGPWLICKMDTAINGISPERCKAIHSTMLSAVTSRKEVGFIFYESAAYPSCGSIPKWDASVSQNIKSLRIVY